MFRRKQYALLQEWKTRSNGRTAVLVEGARRVGKTTLVEAFVSNEYAKSLVVDFSQTSDDVRNLFLDHANDIDTLLRMLQLYHEIELPVRNSAIVFDEVQRFPPAREMIKHLVADGRYDYLETGSLISIKKNVENIVIPSEEERVALRPFDFEEYLWATGHEMLSDEIRRCYETLTPLPDAVHAQAMRLFDEYLVVGGMPQAVAAFAEDATFVECDRRKRLILALYFDDIAKFGGGDSRKALAILKGIPGQLSAQSKRYRFSSLQKGLRYEDYESAMHWLEDSHIVNVCHLCSDPNVGFRLSEVDSRLKCYMVDTGLLVSIAFDEGE